MAKPNLQELLTIPDVLLSDNFEMLIEGFPDIGGRAREALRLQCMNSNLPDKTIEPVSADLFGQQIQFAGRNINGHTLAVTYIESNDLIIYNQINSWMEFIRQTMTQSGQSKSDYAATAKLQMYNEVGEKISSGVYTYHNIWPTNLGNVQVQGDSSTIVQISVTFQYDVWTQTDGQLPAVSPT